MSSFVSRSMTKSILNFFGALCRYFAAEIIGNVLELDQHKWRRPRRMDFRLNKERVNEFKKSYTKYDWTGMIATG